jgi:purine-binding chemotaxis protein CheW
MAPDQMRPLHTPDLASTPAHIGSFKVVVFKIAILKANKKLDYAVRIEQVQEIGTVGSITRVPGAPSYIRGVMNLRGKIITIIDIKEKLGFDPIANDSLATARILVAQIGSKLVGILVDEVDQVLEIPANQLETSSKVIPPNAKYISGIAKHGDRLIVLLELAEIFASTNSTTSGQPNQSCVTLDKPGTAESA